MDESIQAVLDRYPADCRAEGVLSLGSAGGFSGAAIWKLQTARRTLALRRWPKEHPTPERLAWIHDVAVHSLAHGFMLLAQPIPAVDGSTFVYRAGRLWELAPWLPGEAEFHRRPSRERLTNALRTLAEFHRSVESFPNIVQRLGPSPGANERRARIAQLLAGGLAELYAALDARPVSAEITGLGRRFLALFPRAAAAVAPLLEVAARFEVALQPCLRDVWSDHVLFVGDEVSGIIDLGAMRVESVASDIARLLGSLVADDTAGWETGLAAYASVRPLAEQEIRLAAAIDQSNVVLAGTLWLRWILLERRTFDDLETIAGRLRTGLERLERLVERAQFSDLLLFDES